MSTATTGPTTGSISVPVDPARRPDVLLRRRHPVGHQMSAWWPISAFVAVSVVVVFLVNLFPGG